MYVVTKKATYKFVCSGFSLMIAHLYNDFAEFAASLWFCWHPYPPGPRVSARLSPVVFLCTDLGAAELKNLGVWGVIMLANDSELDHIAGIATFWGEFLGIGLVNG